MPLFEIIKKYINVNNSLAIISIFLAFYFYFDAKKEKEPVYYFNDSSIVIYNSENLSNTLKFLTKDSIIIQDNVYLNEIVLWNDGKLPILPSDVRDTFKLIIQGIREILEYKISAESHKSSKFKISQIDFNSFKIDWNYFDPSNAVKFQIIYLGDKIIQPEWKGNILGVNVIKPFNKFKHTVSIIIIIVILIPLLIYFYKLDKAKIPDNKEVYFILKMVLTFIICSVIMVTIIQYLSDISKVPL